MRAVGEFQDNMMGEGSQGGTLPIYNSGSEQSGWSDVSYNVKDSTSLSALCTIAYSRALSPWLCDSMCPPD
jgi:hypothetical protein